MKKRRKLRWASAPNPYRRAASVIAHKLRTMELRCSAFLFDLDGVLVDSRAVVERVCRTWALRHGLDPEKVMRIAHGRRARDTVKAVAPHLDIAREVEWIAAGRAAGARVVALSTTYPDADFTGAEATIRDFTGVRVLRDHSGYVLSV